MNKVATIVPAREESAVIEDLFLSLGRQTVGSDVFVVVERKDDPTVKLAKKYGAEAIVRKKLAPEFQRKGYALAEGVEAILKRKRHYDAYFIVDADDVLAADFTEKMLESLADGAEIATGHRKVKNGKKAFPAAAGMIFTVMNEIINRERMGLMRACVFSGTGFYIEGELIEKWGTWPFLSLTEDYELSLYARKNGIRTEYNSEAVFYDEQPESFSEYFKQRTRWVKGYFEARKKYSPPILMYFIIVLIFGAIIGFFRYLPLVFTIYYICAAVFTGILQKIEKEKLRISAILINPLLLFTYVLCFLRILIPKEVKWEPLIRKRGE